MQSCVIFIKQLCEPEHHQVTRVSETFGALIGLSQDPCYSQEFRGD